MKHYLTYIHAIGYDTYQCCIVAKSKTEAMILARSIGVDHWLRCNDLDNDSRELAFITMRPCKDNICEHYLPL